MQNLCDLGSQVLDGSRHKDPSSFRMSLDGQPVGQMVGISTFAEYTTVDAASAVKIAADIPLGKAALVACGAGTGWGALYTSGMLKLDELITTTYSIDDVAQGYRDMHAGLNNRGVVIFD
jgi:S-(hydroxymethyl)glutathione dehydrogenase/alcohol dehydrogenase